MPTHRVWIARSADRALVLAFVLLAAVGCTSSDGDPGRLEGDGFSVVPPEGWEEPDGPAVSSFEVVRDDPSETAGRLGILRVEGLDDVRAYAMDTTGVGAELRGLETETHDTSEVEVDGAVEARLTHYSYTAPTPDAPRVRAAQLVARDDDGTGFDLRLEALEGDWDDADYDRIADEIVTSFRLD